MYSSIERYEEAKMPMAYPAYSLRSAGQRAYRGFVMVCISGCSSTTTC